MPATSKRQFKIMKAVCEGTYPSGYRGITKKVACEFIKGQSPKGLPTRVKEKKRKTKKKKRAKKKSSSMKKMIKQRLK